METEQLSLFEAAGNPLEERLGTLFFDSLPTTPGVYLMYGKPGHLLYVGKSKNLRKRLFTYRRIKSGKGRRKIRRLVGMTTDIEIIECETEKAALLKENALIRNLKPEFNRAKKSPETYYFLTLRPGEEKYYFRLAMAKPEKEQDFYHTYGSIQGASDHSQGHWRTSQTVVYFGA